MIKFIIIYNLIFIIFALIIYLFIKTNKLNTRDNNPSETQFTMPPGLSVSNVNNLIDQKINLNNNNINSRITDIQSSIITSDGDIIRNSGPSELGYELNVTSDKVVLNKGFEINGDFILPRNSYENTERTYYDSFLPRGSIVPWYPGHKDTNRYKELEDEENNIIIPKGWAICDGRTWCLKINGEAIPTSDIPKDTGWEVTVATTDVNLINSFREWLESGVQDISSEYIAESIYITPNLVNRTLVGTTGIGDGQEGRHNNNWHPHEAPEVDGCGNESCMFRLGDRGGVMRYLLKNSQMPSHNHGGNTGDTSTNFDNIDDYDGDSSNINRLDGGSHRTYSESSPNHSHTIPNDGGTDHTYFAQPFTAVHFLVKL